MAKLQNQCTGSPSLCTLVGQQGCLQIIHFTQNTTSTVDNLFLNLQPLFWYLVSSAMYCKPLNLLHYMYEQ